MFLISALGLFLELLLIRWVSTEIRIFAYLQNTVLVVCFLGLGMGCWNSRRPFALRDILFPLLALVALLAIPTTRVTLGEISTMFAGFGDLLVWVPSTFGEGWSKYASPATGLALTFFLMILLWEIFVPIGRLMGRLIGDHPNTIRAYSANVAGSLVGIWLFVLASAFYLPPVAWFGMFAAMAAFFLGTGGRSKAVDAALLGTIVALSAVAAYEPGWHDVRWTPYQKLAVRDISSHVEEVNGSSHFQMRLRGERLIFNAGIGENYIAVNNTGYQATVDLRPSTVAADPARFDPAQRGLSQYDLPARLHPNPENVLIVGAGSGNDAAGCLRNGAKRVVAVEIDPGIIEFGRKYHPEQPYSDPRVEVVNDDARSYFATSTEKFDVIAFGLLDSHTTTAMTNARLDHYVYTIESISQAQGTAQTGRRCSSELRGRKGVHLRPNGHRARTSVRAQAGRYSWCRATHTAGAGWCLWSATMRSRFESGSMRRPELPPLITEWQKDDPIELTGTTKLATDDWPYIYLEKPSIPVLYYLLAGVLGLLFARGLWKLGTADTVRAWAGSGQALLLPRRRVHAAGSAEHQQGRRGPRQHLDGQRRHHLRRPGHDPVGQPGRGPLPATAAGAGVCPARWQLPGTLPLGPIDLRVPALRDQGPCRWTLDESADALQRHCVHAARSRWWSAKTRLSVPT